MDNGTSMEIDGIIFDGIYLWIIMGFYNTYGNNGIIMGLG